MSDDVPSPGEPLPDGFRRTAVERTRPLALGPASVEVSTAVYEDDALQERIRAAGGPDRSWRFLVVGRVDVPGSNASGALARLVESRAWTSFADRLRDRGVSGVERVERRTLRTGDVEATLARFEGRNTVDGVGLRVEGYLAVAPAPGGAVIAGGAYPRGVEGEGDVAALLQETFDPPAFRDDLLALVRAVCAGERS